VGPRAGLDIEVSGKILCLRQESNADRQVIQPVARLTELPGSHSHREAFTFTECDTASLTNSTVLYAVLVVTASGN
jgi:hypothetical protein